MSEMGNMPSIPKWERNWGKTPTTKERPLHIVASRNETKQQLPWIQGHKQYLQPYRTDPCGCIKMERDVALSLSPVLDRTTPRTQKIESLPKFNRKMFELPASKRGRRQLRQTSWPSEFELSVRSPFEHPSDVIRWAHDFEYWSGGDFEQNAKSLQLFFELHLNIFRTQRCSNYIRLLTSGYLGVSIEANSIEIRTYIGEYSMFDMKSICLGCRPGELIPRTRPTPPLSISSFCLPGFKWLRAPQGALILCK